MNATKLRIQILAVLTIAALIGGFALYQTGIVSEWIGGKPKPKNDATSKYAQPKLVELADGSYGLELSADAIESLELKPKAAVPAKDDVPLPPMIGAVNYDPRRMFSIKPLFAGKVTEIKSIASPEEGAKNGSPSLKDCRRPIKFGDKVKQGDVLAVFWSQSMGEKKAALVDSICSLHLSDNALARQRQLYKEGATSEAAVRAAERQVQQDKNTMYTAERFLRLWELTDAEIKAIKDEAEEIIADKTPRDIVGEVKKWARVEIKAPVFDPANMKRELTIVEQNPNIGEVIDPSSPPLFRLADLSRLQLWVHPPEEYLPILRKQLESGPGGLRWTIRFQADPTKTLDLNVDRIGPSLEPNQRTPMLIGYLDNPEYKYLIGQFVTATIMVRPPEDTVEIPTSAVNPVNGQEFVFVENPEAKNQFPIRRVSVARSIKNVSYVRSKLTAELDQINLDIKEGDYKVRPLQAGDKVVTRGVVELTAALEEARSAKTASK
jgi:membrane fusion protein, heavy metal efflux system